MNGPAGGQLIARHWRTFLPVWLISLPILASVVLDDFAPPAIAIRVLPYFIAVVLVYVIAVQIPPLGLWRRGEITYFQIFLLSTPVALVAITCLIAGAFIHALHS